MTCPDARKQLQECHDAGRTPDEALEQHLGGCEACSRFGRFLTALGAETRYVLDAAARDLPRPDYAAIFAREIRQPAQRSSAAPRLRLALVAAAAVLVAAGGVSAGVSAYLGNRERHRVAEQVGSFVDGLFADPLIADAGFPADGGASGLRDWLEDTEPSPRY